MDVAPVLQEHPVELPAQTLKEQHQPVTPQPTGSTKVKTTPNLKGIFNKPAQEAAPSTTVVTSNEHVTPERLTSAWNVYAEQRKGQAAEYQILKREFEFKPPIVTVQLTNPVEEALLDNFKRDLTQFLRDQLKNSEISIITTMQENGGKKVIYTSKEKFEHLAEKFPYLHEMKEKLGLDWDF